jgi:two-component system nitrate/nitrite response regulator NarL
MNLIVVTPFRLFGDGLDACFHSRADITLQTIVARLTDLHDVLSTGAPDVVLIDVTQGIDLDEARAIAAHWPRVALVALGLKEQRQDIIRCGRAGFCGYVARDASIDHLCQALSDAQAGRLSCSAEISGGLLRALFRMEVATPPQDSLTQRQSQVLQLLGRGLSNKEIARDLSLSLSTVKHHVHHVLEKLHLPGRAQAMRRVRERPWIAEAPSFDEHPDVD